MSEVWPHGGLQERHHHHDVEHWRPAPADALVYLFPESDKHNHLDQLDEPIAQRFHVRAGFGVEMPEQSTHDDRRQY